MSFLAKDESLSPEEDVRLREVYGYLKGMNKAAGSSDQYEDELAVIVEDGLGQDDERAPEDLGQDEDELHLLLEDEC